MAMYSLALSIGFMIAFPVVGSLVQSRGWRSTWLAIGIALLAVHRADQLARRAAQPRGDRRSGRTATTSSRGVNAGSCG